MLSVAIVSAMVAHFMSYVVVQMWMVFTNEHKHLLGTHCKIDHCLIHIQDKMLGAVAANNDAVHEQHGVKHFAFNFGGSKLRCVCPFADSISCWPQASAS